MGHVMPLKLPYKPGPYDTAIWSVETQGALTAVKATGAFVFPGRGGPGRTIGGFSSQSRLRLLKASARVNWFGCGESLFVTLTYPDTCLTITYQERSQHRYLFHRYLESYLERKVPAFWRIEWKPRRSGRYKGFLCPHIHLMILAVPYLPWELIRRWWRSILHHTGVLKTWVSKIRGPEGAARYIAKYVSKVSSLDYVTHHNSAVTIGRSWGILRSRQIPRYPVTLFRTISASEVQFLKGLRTYIPRREEFWREAGFVIFGRDVAEQVAEILQSPLAEGEVLE